MINQIKFKEVEEELRIFDETEEAKRQDEFSRQEDVKSSEDK